MKILHCSDLHIGVESYGRIDPETGLSSRLGDFLAALDEVVDYALDQDVDLFLFCGDAYKSRDPSQTHQREFARRIARLAAAGIPVFLLVGNHDLPNAIGRATAVDIFDTLAIRNVIVANRPATHRIETKNGALQIVALPWARRSALLSRDETRGLAPDQLNQRLESILTEWLTHEAESLDPSLPAILAAHLAHSGAVPGSERTMMVGQNYVLLQSNVANPAFDYVALGHIHRQQKVEYPVPVVYPGSLGRIDFGDEHQEKGFYVVEIDEAKGARRAVHYEFKPVATRRFLTIKVNADTEEPTATVLRAIAKENVTDAIVRVQIKVSPTREGLIQENDIRKALKDAHFIAAITKEVEREQRLRLGDYSAEGITPIDVLKVYLESKKTPPDRISQLLEYGQRLIDGERQG